MTDDEMFALANRAFDLMTLAERKEALRHFASLRYPSIADRLIEAADYVIKRGPADASAPEGATTR